MMNDGENKLFRMSASFMEVSNNQISNTDKRNHKSTEVNECTSLLQGILIIIIILYCNCTQRYIVFH